MTEKKQQSLKRFYKGFLVPLFLFGLYFGIMSAVLTRSGEYLSIEKTVEKLDRTHGLYGSALYQRTFYFKEEIYKFYKPEVVPLGSSRVLQFRQDYFTKPFINLGTISSLDEAMETGRNIFPEHTPQKMILGLDFWWFHPSREEIFIPRSERDATLTLSDMLEPATWLVSGKLRFSDVFHLLTSETPHAGIAAVSRGDGFDRFGSYFYTSIYTGRKKSQDINFANTLEKMKTGEGVLVHGDTVSESRWAAFEALVNYYQSLGIEMVIFLPPIPPMVLQAMNDSGDYGYVDTLRPRLAAFAKERDIPVFDFHDMQRYGSGDCEYYDGVHGGENTYNRILLHMALKNGMVRDVVDLPKLGWAIRRLKDRASSNPDEIDFLGLGCDKGFKE